MIIKLLYAVLALLITCAYNSAGAGEASVLESVPDLEKSMYHNIEGYPCVRLLNLSGRIGCSNPGDAKVIAPIVKLENYHDQLVQLSAVLISLDEMEDFFLRVSGDFSFAQKIAGVLVSSTTYKSKLLNDFGFSPVGKFPQAEFAPYQSFNYTWNPSGSGIMWHNYNFPVFLLSEYSTSIVQEMARSNAKSLDTHTLNVAEFDLVMQTTRVGSHDSESCLKELSCLPLGGYSVWSSLPPIHVSSVKSREPIILVSASQDSASFFRDRSIGADSPISGLIALLAAVDALAHADVTKVLQKQLVFAVFTGEAWGYLGSRRFLAELEIGSDSVRGLDKELFEKVLDIGSVGKAFNHGATTLYAHSEQSSAGTREILSALKMASDSLGADNVKIIAANPSNPGVPPSSLMSFLRKNSSIAGIVLEEFDASFTNKFYYSHLDDPSNINSSSVAAAAILIARALYILATDVAQPNLIEMNFIKVNVTLVEEMVRCLLTCSPGLSCDLVKNFISPSRVCPSHYVGVFQDSPINMPPQYVDDTSRFVWNFLADRTSSLSSSRNSCTSDCSHEGELCVGAEAQGRCVVATTRYVPAYSTRLKFEGNFWQVMPSNSSDPLESVDPLWTESFWSTIGLRVYAVQSSTYNQFVLLSGLGITVAAYIGIIVTRTCLIKALKRD